MKEKFYISLGIWIALLPFLGIPVDWRNGLIAGSGLLLALISIAPFIFKEVQPKAKPKRRTSKIEPVNTENKVELEA